MTPVHSKKNTVGRPGADKLVSLWSILRSFRPQRGLYFGDIKQWGRLSLCWKETNKQGSGDNKCLPLCAITWCNREGENVSHAPLGLLLYSKHHRCLLNQHWRTVREQIKSTESVPSPFAAWHQKRAASVRRQTASMREAITHKTTLACLSAVGWWLKSVFPPCREKRQVEERVTKRERKVEREKDGWRVWGGGGLLNLL